MRVLITGAGGQLGQDLLDAFSADEVVGLTHAELDVASEVAVIDAVERHRPELLVNAAAWTNVDACEADPRRAHAVNALGPWWLARACADGGVTLITYSTDYVFDGEAPLDAAGEPRALTEFDPIAPLNIYGRSKAAGERLVREALREHHIIRTAWVCGARGNNFVRTMLRLADRGEPVSVVDDQVGSPTFTRDLAMATREVAVSGRYGTWNRTNAGRCSWYDLAEAAFEQAGVEVDLRRQSSAALERSAPRPSWSVLDDTHATTAGLSPLPPWRDGLRHLLDELRRDDGPAR